MAQFKFPSAIAPVHFSAYGKCPEAAKAIPTAFKMTTSVNSFLVGPEGQ
jgi:hypothetical protein